MASRAAVVIGERPTPVRVRHPAACNNNGAPGPRKSGPIRPELAKIQAMQGCTHEGPYLRGAAPELRDSLTPTALLGLWQLGGVLGSG